MEKVTIVIPTLNNRTTSLERILSVVRKSNINLCKVLVVNTSNKDLILRINSPNTQVINCKNLLHAKNLALRKTKTRWLLLLDDDVVFTEDVLEDFLKKSTFHKFAACSPYVYTGKYYSRPDLLNFVSYGKFSFFKLPSLNERGRSKQSIIPADFLPGCFCLYKVGALNSVGGWDANYLFPFYNEDTDLSYRLSNIPAKLGILNDIEVLHKRASGGVRSKYNKYKWFFSFGYNNSYYYFKNFNLLYYLLYTILRFRDLFYVLKQFSFSIYLSYLKGIYAGYKKARN